MKTFVSNLVLSVAIALSACDSNAQKKAGTMNGFDKQGHRGSRGLMPENTIPAMIHALDLGVTTLEMDVVITADKKVILSHDARFNPATTTLNGEPITGIPGDSLVIYNMSYAQTQAYDVGLRPYPAFPRQKKIAVTKPLLADLIDSVEAYIKLKGMLPVHYNIETKSQLSGDNKLHPAPAEFVALVMDIVKQKNITERTIIQSFDFRTLQVMHEKYPEVRLAALIENKKSVEENIKALGFTPEIYSPYFRLVDEASISKCHEMKMLVIPWTVNSSDEIARLRGMGVDGIITDYPDLFTAENSAKNH